LWQGFDITGFLYGFINYLIMDVQSLAMPTMGVQSVCFGLVIALRPQRFGLVLLLLYAHRHPSILGAAGHIILTPANQLMEE
jgi:hypothetical protein